MIGDDKLFAPLPRKKWGVNLKKIQAAAGSKNARKALTSRCGEGLRLYWAKKRKAKREADNAAR